MPVNTTLMNMLTKTWQLKKINKMSAIVYYDMTIAIVTLSPIFTLILPNSKKRTIIIYFNLT